MSTPQYDIVIEQGATFYLPLTILDVNDVALDVSGYTAAMQGRTTVEATATSFILASPADIVLAVDGSCTVMMSAAATAALTDYAGVYDLVLTSPVLTVTRVIQGAFTVTKQVTR